MKALVYEKAHSLADFAIKLVEIPVPIPTPRENDVLVDVRAIGINPGEAAIRSMRSAEPGGRGLLGWEFAGVVSAVGAAVARCKVGDRVFGTGDMIRDGCWGGDAPRRAMVSRPRVVRKADGRSTCGLLTVFSVAGRDGRWGSADSKNRPIDVDSH
jgi:NADPH2:quinone reductase